MLFVLLTADPHRSSWPGARATRLTFHSIFLELIMQTLTFSAPLLQQVQTCVWDVSSPFKIVLVNASKVNAEETAKVS